MKEIFYAQPDIDDNDVEAVVNVLKSGFLSGGPVVKEFERELSYFLNVPHVVTVSSGSTALDMLIRQSNISQWIMPDIYFHVATHFIAASNIHLMDVSPVTGMPTVGDFVNALERTDKKSPVGVIFCNLGGDILELKDFRIAATENGCADIFIIEDSAHALHASLDADATILSFNALKPVTTGEGGAIVSHHINLDAFEIMRHYGVYRTPHIRLSEGPWAYENLFRYGNAKLSDLNCALGLSQLLSCRSRRNAREAHVVQYAEMLKPLGFVQCTDLRDTWAHLARFMLPPSFKELHNNKDFVIWLTKKGINTQKHYMPLHRRMKLEYPFPGADAHYTDVISLPCHSGLDEYQIQYVCEMIKIYMRG